MDLAGQTFQEEDQRHDTNNSPLPLTRAEHIFLDRIDTDDEGRNRRGLPLSKCRIFDLHSL